MAGKVAGAGSGLLLCLPGFGNDRDWFDGLLEGVAGGCRVAVCELPCFYGSTWAGEGKLDVEVMGAWLDAVRRHFGVEKVDLLGFSLGARAVLGMYLGRLEGVGRVMLLSPDGLRVHWLYWFAMYTVVGGWLFKLVMGRPAVFLGFLRILYRIRVLDGAVYRLAVQQLVSAPRRVRLSGAWVAWSGLRPRLGEVRAKAGGVPVDWHVVWGRDDRLLSPGLGRRFVRRVPGARLVLLEGGHFFVRAPRADFKALFSKWLEAIGCYA